MALLLAAAARGDEDAWRQILDRYGRRVFALARSRCRSDDLAEEVTQSVFVTVAAKLGQGGYLERGRFESWLFRVAMNRLRDEMRRQKRQAEPTDPTTVGAMLGPAIPDEPTDETLLARLRAALAQLGEADREIIELRHHAGMGFRQIADLLEEPLGTLLARHHRALHKLRRLMGVDGGEGGGGKARGPIVEGVSSEE